MTRRPPLTSPTAAPGFVDQQGSPANDRVYAQMSAPNAASAARADGSITARSPTSAGPPSRERLKVVPVRTVPSLTATEAWGRGVVDFAFSRSTFTYALTASLIVHGAIFAIRFGLFDFNKMIDRGPQLEVTLVNAKSESKPAKPEILAQANLDGGGNTETPRRAKSPLPVLPRQRPVEEIALATERLDTLERQTKELMTQMHGAPLATAPPTPAAESEQPQLPSATALMQKTLEVMRLEAQIAKEMDGYQNKPRRKHLGASAEEYRFARYVEDWRQKVERIGNLNYPDAARQLKLYGNLILTVSIRSDGSVDKVVVERSSGRKILDAAAIRIVEMASPYAPFPKDIERDTDVLDITRTWTFAKGDELRSE